MTPSPRPAVPQAAGSAQNPPHRSKARVNEHKGHNTKRQSLLQPELATWTDWLSPLPAQTSSRQTSWRPSASAPPPGTATPCRRALLAPLGEKHRWSGRQGIHIPNSLRLPCPELPLRFPGSVEPHRWLWSHPQTKQCKGGPPVQFCHPFP